MLLKAPAAEIAKALDLTHAAQRRLVRIAARAEHAGGTCVGLEFIARGFGWHMQPQVFLSVLLIVFLALCTASAGGE